MVRNDIEHILDLAHSKSNQCILLREANDSPHLIGELISALSNKAAFEEKECSYLIYEVPTSSHNSVGTNLDLELDSVNLQKLNNWLTELLYPSGIFSFESAIINKRKVILIKIKRAVNSATTFNGNEYLLIDRNPIGPIRDSELKRDLWHKVLSTGNDTNSCLDVTRKEIEKYLDIKQYYSLLKKEIPTNFNEVLSRLLNEGFIKKRDDNRFSVTVLGMLCIATSFSYVPSLSESKIEIVKNTKRNQGFPQLLHLLFMIKVTYSHSKKSLT